MITLGFAVRRIPNELPPIVLALFTGLNSAAVGLVCVAAYQLSKKVSRVPAQLSLGLSKLTSQLCLVSSAPLLLPESINSGCHGQRHTHHPLPHRVGCLLLRVAMVVPSADGACWIRKPTI